MLNNFKVSIKNSIKILYPLSIYKDQTKLKYLPNLGLKICKIL